MAKSDRQPRPYPVRRFHAVRIALWCTALILAFLAGRKWPVAPSTPGGGAGTGAPRLELAVPGPGGGDGTTPGSDPAAALPGGATSAAAAAMPADTLRAALDCADPAQRLSLLCDAVAHADTRDFAEMVELLDETPSFERSRFMEPMLYTWARLDPEAAVAYAEDRPVDADAGECMGYAIAGWASLDPTGALRWTDERYDEPSAALSTGLLRGLAAQDPELATEVAYTLPLSAVIGPPSQLLIGQYFSRGPEVMAGWAEDLRPGPLKDYVVREVAQRLAALNPTQYEMWPLRLTNEVNRAAAAAAFSRSWARSDPQAAVDWAAILPDPAPRLAAIATAVEQWGEADAVAAAEWVSRYPASLGLDPARRALAYRLLDEDPGRAYALAVMLTDPSERHRLIQQVAERLRLPPVPSGE